MVLFKLIPKSRPLLNIAIAAAGAALLIAGIIYGYHPVWASDLEMNLHKLHVAEQGLTCEDCHAPQQVIRKENCQNCHEPDQVAMYLQEFHEQVIIPGMAPCPRDHADDFRRAHGPQAELDPNRCTECHAQRFCQNCHEGVNLQGRIHPLNFVQVHPFEARGQEEECLSCHQTRQFCVDCHNQPGHRVINHPVGPGWANTTEGGAHRDEASTGLESCLDCHDLGAADPVCTRPGCHDGSKGGE
jgi:hypothetical protein